MLAPGEHFVEEAEGRTPKYASHSLRTLRIPASLPPLRSHRRLLRLLCDARHFLELHQSAQCVQVGKAWLHRFEHSDTKKFKPIGQLVTGSLGQRDQLLPSNRIGLGQDRHLVVPAIHHRRQAK